MREYIESNLQRIIEARRLADSVQNDEPLHRIMMRGVFALEDVQEMLVRVAAEQKAWVPSAGSSPERRSLPEPVVAVRGAGNRI